MEKLLSIMPNPNLQTPSYKYSFHYSDVIMDAMTSQITSLTIVYSTVYSGTDQRKHQSSASLAFVRGIHRGPVNSPHKWPVTRKMFPFDDVIIQEKISTNGICTMLTTSVRPQYESWQQHVMQQVEINEHQWAQIDLMKQWFCPMNRCGSGWYGCGTSDVIFCII